MYEWSWVIFAKKSKFHDAGGPDTVVSPYLRHFFINFQNSCACVYYLCDRPCMCLAACFVTWMEHPVYYVTVCHTLYVLNSLFCRLDGTPCILCDTPCMCLAACFVAWMESSPLRRDTWTQHGEGRCCHCRGVVPSWIMEEHVFGAFVHIQIFAISILPI